LDNPHANRRECSCFESFLQSLRALGRREKTLRSYAFDWRLFSQWYQQTNGEPFDLRRLSTIDLQDYKSHLMTREHAPATINRRLVFLKRYAGFGVEQGAVRQNLHRAFQQVQRVRQQSLAPKSVSSREVRRFLKELELLGNLRDQAIIYLFLYSGLRVGELVRLRREDLALSEKKGTIHIRSEIAKGGRERTVPVPLEARRRLQAYLDSRKDDLPELFLGQRGPIQEDAVVRIIRKYAERIGLTITPHQLRHTFAYQYLAKNSNDLVGLAAILGHESLNTTRLYTQKRLEDLQESAERVGYF
jgi:integrase